VRWSAAAVRNRAYDFHLHVKLYDPIDLGYRSQRRRFMPTTSNLAFTAAMIAAVANTAPLESQDATAAAGYITGRTVSTDGKPLVNVSVALACPPVNVQYVMSDSSGRFEFSSPPGNCRLIARKDGYVEESLSGDPAPGGYGIAVRGGTRYDGIELQLARGATISGVISVVEGTLPEGVRFQTLRRETRNGATTFVPQSYLIVGRNGRIKTAAVMPGDYYVVASPAPAGSPGATSGFAVTYFPGTPRLNEATFITLKEGDHPELSFQLVAAPTFSISGIVYDASGRPLQDVSIGVSFDSPPNWIRGSGRTRSDGRFSISGLQNGSYVLLVIRKNADGQREMAEVHFEVNGADIQDLIARMAVR
jgi:Carboxypeptidase regulatory-like domain